MSEIPQTLPGHRRGRTKVVQRRQTDPRSTKRDPSSTGVMLLGRGPGDTLPELGSLPSTYQIGTNGELLYRLCVALVERHLVDENLWHEAGKIPVVFARNAILRMIDKEAGEVFKDNLQYECIVSDTLSSGCYSGAALDEGKLVAMFDLTTAGFLVIGAAIRVLDEQEPSLGAAFYLLLTVTLRRHLRLYDHVAASWYNERLLEMMEEDDPENHDSYEFPKVEECIPPSVKAIAGWNDGRLRSLLRRHLNGPHGAWIEKLFLIERLTRLSCKIDRFEGEYDDAPVPSVLIVFRENDAVSACWDAESAHFNEANNEPSFTVCSVQTTGMSSMRHSEAHASFSSSTWSLQALSIC